MRRTPGKSPHRVGNSAANASTKDLKGKAVPVGRKIETFVDIAPNIKSRNDWQRTVETTANQHGGSSGSRTVQKFNSNRRDAIRDRSKSTKQLFPVHSSSSKSKSRSKSQSISKFISRSRQSLHQPSFNHNTQQKRTIDSESREHRQTIQHRDSRGSRDRKTSKVPSHTQHFDTGGVASRAKLPRPDPMKSDIQKRNEKEKSRLIIRSKKAQEINKGITFKPRVIKQGSVKNIKRPLLDHYETEDDARMDYNEVYKKAYLLIGQQPPPSTPPRRKGRDYSDSPNKSKSKSSRKDKRYDSKSVILIQAHWRAYAVRKNLLKKILQLNLANSRKKQRLSRKKSLIWKDISNQSIQLVNDELPEDGLDSSYKSLDRMKELEEEVNMIKQRLRDQQRARNRLEEENEHLKEEVRQLSHNVSPAQSPPKTHDHHSSPAEVAVPVRRQLTIIPSIEVSFLKKQLESYNCSPKFNMESLKSLFDMKQEQFKRTFTKLAENNCRLLDDRLISPKTFVHKKSQIEAKMKRATQAMNHHLLEAKKVVQFIKSDPIQIPSSFEKSEQLKPNKEGPLVTAPKAEKAIHSQQTPSSSVRDYVQIWTQENQQIHQQSRALSQRISEAMMKPSEIDNDSGGTIEQVADLEPSLNPDDELTSSNEQAANVIEIFRQINQKPLNVPQDATQPAVQPPPSGFDSSLQAIRLYIISLCEFIRSGAETKEQFYDCISKPVKIDLVELLRSYRKTIEGEQNSEYNTREHCYLYAYFKTLKPSQPLVGPEYYDLFNQQNSLCEVADESVKEMKKNFLLALIDALNEALQHQRPGGADGILPWGAAKSNLKNRSAFKGNPDDSETLDRVFGSGIATLIEWGQTLAGFIPEPTTNSAQNPEIDPAWNISDDQLNTIQESRMSIMLEKSLVESERLIVDYSQQQAEVMLHVAETIAELLFQEATHEFGQLTGEISMIF